MENGFARWYVKLFLFVSCCYLNSQAGQEIDYLWEDDISLILPDDEPERLVSITGELQLHVLNTDPEDSELGAFNCWILKMSPESFAIACSTPVRAAFQSPKSIRSCLNCNELELTGDHDVTWLKEHIGEMVTLSGYLWHAHTAHHHTPIMMDTNPWLIVD